MITFFSSTNIEHTNVPGSASSDGEPSIFYIFSADIDVNLNDTNSDGPATEGYTYEKFTFPQTTNNISDVSQDCECFETTTFSSETLEAQSQNTGKCECPETLDRNDQIVVDNETGTK
jgi:hypothetical protein